MKIFVAYSRVNINSVVRLVSALDRHFGKQNVWFAHRDITADDDIPKTVASAIEDSDIFLNCASRYNSNISAISLRYRKINLESLSYLIEERRIALENSVKIINISLSKHASFDGEYANFATIRLTTPAGSAEWEESIQELINLILGRKNG